MPEMDGFETTRAIRDMESEIGRLPILGVTAAAGNNELRACLDAGMDDVMSKPINERQLLAAIARLTTKDAAVLPIETDQTVLVIDDVATNLIVAEKQLKRLGIACETTNSAEAGLTHMDGRDFGAVLVDISMPGMDGLAFTARVRARDEETGRHTPVIAMTGHAGADDRQRSLAAGLDEILSKPLLIEELAVTLRTTLVGAPPPAPNAVVPSSEDPAVIDLAKLAEILGESDKTELMGFVTRFADYFPTLLVAIETALEDRDAQALEDQAHAAKGAAASAAAEALRVGLAEIEKSAQFDDWDAHARRVAAIKADFDRVVAFAQNG